jgi:phage baseplate assembly protein W
VSGLNRQSGAALEGWPHVLQSLLDVWTTPKGTRVMLREYGCDLVGLIDRPAGRDTVLEAIMAVMDAEQWEPRFRIRECSVTQAGADGVFTLIVSGVYYLRGHLGDFSVFEPLNNVEVRL